jgi:hypothetical protein
VSNGYYYIKGRKEELLGVVIELYKTSRAYLYGI